MLSLDKLDQPVNPVGVVDRIRTQPKKLLPGELYSLSLFSLLVCCPLVTTIAKPLRDGWNVAAGRAGFWFFFSALKQWQISVSGCSPVTTTTKAA